MDPSTDGMMKEEFLEIKKRYDLFYKELLKKGKLPMRDTEKGFWGISHPEDIFKFFKKIKLQGYNKFMDIGSGDGSVVLIASLFGLDCTGIEIDEELFKIGKKVQKEFRIKNVNFICDDFFKHDFSQYDILFVNPDQGFHRGLERKLLQELKGELYVYNFVFKPEKIKKGRTFYVNQMPITCYTK